MELAFPIGVCYKELLEHGGMIEGVKGPSGTRADVDLFCDKICLMSLGLIGERYMRNS